MTKHGDQQVKQQEKKQKGVSTATKVLLGLTGLGFMVCTASIGAATYFVIQGDQGEVADGSFLRVPLSGKITDAPVSGGIFTEPDKLPPVATEIARAIRQAGGDERISGLYLDMGSVSLGWANAQEVRNAIVQFQESGKPCVAYSESYSTQDYYVASACKTVLLAPNGAAMISGLSVSVTYYADTFEKLGVRPQFEHVGDFKTGPEPYMEAEPSLAAKESYNSFLDSLYAQVVLGISESRSLSIGEVKERINHPGLSPKLAVKQGFVDGLFYEDQVKSQLSHAAEADWLSTLGKSNEDLSKDAEEDLFTPMSEYLKSVRAKDESGDVKIAIVFAEGAIVSGSGKDGIFDENRLADGPFIRWMKSVREDESVEAVVIRVNSPGGSGLASDMMWREIVKTKEAGKPVVVSMANYAASGGYYIAAPADWIVAQPLTLTGSIGVFGGKFDVSGAFDKLGMHSFQYKRGDNSDLFSGMAPFSEEGRLIFRAYLEGFYTEFVTKVSEGRSRSYDEIHQVAQGRVWMGVQAIDKGLVDELGGLDVALTKAASLAHIEGDYGLDSYPKRMSFFETVVDDLNQVSSPTIQLPFVDASGAIDELIVLDEVLADSGVALLLPGSLRVE